MLVGLVVGLGLEQEMGTVAMDGGSFFRQLVFVADVQGFEVPFKGSFVVSKFFVVALCLSIQFSHHLLLCMRA